jgi:hypothetical protein
MMADAAGSGRYRFHPPARCHRRHRGNDGNSAPIAQGTDAYALTRAVWQSLAMVTPSFEKFQ